MMYVLYTHLYYPKLTMLLNIANILDKIPISGTTILLGIYKIYPKWSAYGVS